MITIKEVIIKCNMCGQKSVNKNNYYDIHEFKAKAEYGSKFDGKSIEFHLCDDCLQKINGQFKYDCLGVD